MGLNMFEVEKQCPFCHSKYTRHDDWDITLYTKMNEWYPMTVVLPDMIIDYQLGLSLRQLVVKYGFNIKTIRRQFVKAGISTRESGRLSNLSKKLLKEKLDEYYKTK